MNSIDPTHIIKHWNSMGLVVDLNQGYITKAGGTMRLEPLVIDLLKILLKQPNEVVSKTDILEQLWSGKYVNDEALTKLISKLRKAFDDDPKKPQYIKTIPKKGYVLLFDTNHTTNPKIQKPPALRNKPIYWITALPLLLVFSLSFYFFKIQPQTPTKLNNIERLYDRAESHYYQYSRVENESALKLYEKIIATDPNHALSQSGLANALVQKTLRWPNKINEPAIKHTNLTDAIETGRLDNENAQLQLTRAEGLAKRATVLAPESAKAQRTLGLVYATMKKFKAAEQQYQKAIALDPNEWGAMINLSEIQEHAGKHKLALNTLKQAFAAMTRVYEKQEVLIRPWYAKLGVAIAEKSYRLDNLPDAEIWFRQVLEIEPFNEIATIGLINLLKQQGDTDTAKSLCYELKQKVSPQLGCDIDFN